MCRDHFSGSHAFTMRIKIERCRNLTVVLADLEFGSSVLFRSAYRDSTDLPNTRINLITITCTNYFTKKLETSYWNVISNRFLNNVFAFCMNNFIDLLFFDVVFC